MIERPQVKIKLTHPKSKAPSYAKPGDAGADVFAVEEVDIPQGGTALVDIGLSIELPEGWECQVRSRSGLACKGIVVANSPGTVDEGYRGPIKVILHNNRPALPNSFGFCLVDPYKVNVGDKIAQLVFKPVSQAVFETVDELGISIRGTGGFGSTGK